MRSRHLISVIFADLIRFSVTFGKNEDVLWKDDSQVSISVRGERIEGVRQVKITVTKGDDVLYSLFPGEMDDETSIKECLIEVLDKSGELQLLSR